jgi:hypothetical protein
MLLSRTSTCNGRPSLWFEERLRKGAGAHWLCYCQMLFERALPTRGHRRPDARFAELFANVSQRRCGRDISRRDPATLGVRQRQVQGNRRNQPRQAGQRCDLERKHAHLDAEISGHADSKIAMDTDGLDVSRRHVFLAPFRGAPTSSRTGNPFKTACPQRAW